MDEEPKFGLMVSLVLMNLTAVALFFLATPFPKKQDAENPQHIQVKQVEMVMAGDAETKLICDEAVLPMLTNEAELGSVPSLKQNMGELDGENPLYFTHAPNSSSKVERQVFMPTSNRTSQQQRVSTENAEPPLAIAMKKFVRNTKSGMMRLFKGLKNGYTEMRVGPESRTKLENKQLPKVFSPERDSQDFSWIWGPWDDGSNINQETTISTEIVMDVLSKTQRRTAELIEVFSKKVVPAIERMNDKVAEAVRLEKNLDSYTSTLISAIDSVVCPASEKDPKIRQPENSVVKKPRHTNPFHSDLSLVRDSRLHDYVGSFSKGEHSKPTKRPVFKTLTARCLHYRHKKIPSKRKRCQEISEQHIEHRSFEGQTLHSELGPLGVDEPYLTEPTSLFETENSHGKYIDPIKDKYPLAPENYCISQGLSKLEESPHKRTISIEDVLALTSSLEQSSCDHDVRSEMDFKPVQSCLSSDFSVSSGMRMRSPYFIVTPIHDSTLIQAEEKSTGATLISLHNECPELTTVRHPELAGHSAELAQQPSGTLTSDCSIVCDSRIQGYDSYLARRESSTIAQHHFGNEPRTIDLKSTLQNTESKYSVSGNMKNTNDLVKIFKRLDLHEKEIVMENVCLLVMRIFEAWSESQQPISPMGISKISLSSWSSKDEGLRKNRSATAILGSTNIGSFQEHQSYIHDGFTRNNISKHPLPDEQGVNLPTQLNCSASSTEISRSLVQCAVEAAEVQIAERSLKDLKTNFRTLSTKGDKFYLGSPDTGNPSGFGDMNDSITAIENQNLPLVSKSHDSIAEASKESSSATFFTDQPESSEDAFYECISTISAGTYSLDLEDSNKLFLERIQEEETKHREKRPEEKAVIKFPQSSLLSIEPVLNESGEDSFTKEYLQSQEFSDNSSVDVGWGTDDETYRCNSLDSTDEFGADVSQRGKQKKKKWGVRLLKKFLKKKPKPSSFPITTSNGASRSQLDSAVVMLSDQTSVKNVDEQAQ